MNDLAGRYAAALYDLTQDESAFADATEALTGHAALWEALSSPVIRVEEKKAVLARLPFWGESETLLHFCQLLCDRDRMSMLPEILSAYRALGLEKQGIAACEMSCVHVPDQTQQEQISQMLCKLHGKREVRLDIHTDPALLGGFVLRIEGVTYDRSVLGQLERLELQLQERRIV